MTEINSERIIDGICRALKAEFGDRYRIYTEKVEQNFKRPCFFVEKTDWSCELFRGDRYYVKGGFKVTAYVPFKGNCQMGELSERLSLALEEIYPDGEPLRNLCCTISFDRDELECGIEFGFYAMKQKEKEDFALMEEYSLHFKEEL